MEVTRALATGRRLLREHGLDDWTIVADRAKTRAGVCRFAKRQIGLSAPLTALHSEDEVLDTILHEIAHALVGPQHGHDAVWRAKARAIGCSGERCVSSDAPRVPGDWVGRCPAGHEKHRHRAPARLMSCGECSRRFDPRHLFTWTYRGRPATLPGTYAAQLAALAATRRPTEPLTATPRVGDLVEVVGRSVAGPGGRGRARGRGPLPGSGRRRRAGQRPPRGRPGAAGERRPPHLHQPRLSQNAFPASRSGPAHVAHDACQRRTATCREPSWPRSAERRCWPHGARAGRCGTGRARCWRTPEPRQVSTLTRPVVRSRSARGDNGGVSENVVHVAAPNGSAPRGAEHGDGPFEDWQPSHRRARPRLRARRRGSHRHRLGGRHHHRPARRRHRRARRRHDDRHLRRVDGRGPPPRRHRRGQRLHPHPGGCPAGELRPARPVRRRPLRARPAAPRQAPGPRPRRPGRPDGADDERGGLAAGRSASGLVGKAVAARAGCS